jgi:uncharacterized caspase-like protein
MKRLGILALPVFLFAAWQAAAQAPAAPRVALVIGNGKYADAPLPNAAHDAQDMARELRAAGYHVVHRENASLREMHLALREFGDKLGKTSNGVFYYAGHGLQVRGRNFLVPVDADIAREDEVQFSALDLGAVMDKLDTARNPVNVVILDACRNNPFSKRFNVAQGLAQVDAPPGTLIAFSTAPGSVAADGAGRNGLYTRHLLEQMRKPGTSVEETFKAVRAAVRKESAGRQVPWESTSLETHFAFVPPAARPPPPVLASAPAKAPGGAQQRRSLSPPAAPPAFAPGDTWTYRVRNLADDSERRLSMTVREIRGSEVIWNGEQVSDLLGNFKRSRRGESFHVFTPSAQMYVFPLTQGARFTLAGQEDAGGKRLYDLEVELTIGGEEEVTTPAGKFRAIRLGRKVKWTQREKPSNAGVNEWTYWYSGEAKRFVAAVQENVTNAGKRLQHERFELESFKVK